MVARAVRGGLRDCHTMTAVKSLNRMSQVWDNSTVSAVQCWGLAQSVEHAAVNRSVVGSSPTGGVFGNMKSDTKFEFSTRLHGQAVKTPPFHGGNRGSNPLGVIM